MSLTFDEQRTSGPSQTPPREPVYACHGVAASAHPFATETALAVMRAGGNAVDAALAAGAVLMTVEPRNGHLGGEGFMLVARPGEPVVALNGSGAAPVAATLDRFAGGFPSDGLTLATVPGVVGLWASALERFGTKPLDVLLAPAIAYARRGVPVTPRFHSLLTRDSLVYAKYPDSARVFLPGGNVPPVGSLLPQSGLADSLENIATHGPDTFYRGALTERMLQASARLGGLFTADDFAEHATEIATPLSIPYRGFEIVVSPPVSQGIVVLLALRILSHFDLTTIPNESAVRQHLIIEALKLAFEDRERHLGDPRFVQNPLEMLLSDANAERQAAAIDLHNARNSGTPVPISPDTTFAAFADGSGMLVSYIHSLYAGSGVVLGDTGVLMNSRMTGFTLDPKSPNVLAPRKRPIHTLNTYMIRKDGETLVTGGTPGAHWQVQTNLQIITNIIDYGMDVTAAIAAPRVTIGDQYARDPMHVKIESRVGPAVVAELRAKGHPLEVIGAWESGGAVQLVARDPRSGILRGATEVRRAGCTVSGF